jgi:hypothetical protein
MKVRGYCSPAKMMLSFVEVLRSVKLQQARTAVQQRVQRVHMRQASCMALLGLPAMNYAPRVAQSVMHILIGAAGPSRWVCQRWPPSC